MRLVIQRVSAASVCVGKKVTGEIGQGLLVLVGVAEGDDEKDAAYLSDKVGKLRLMADSNSKMNLSVKETDSSILAVSQFTLHAGTRKGNRPSFIKAAKPEVARTLYETFLDLLEKQGIKVETGEFGSYMRIKANLDGPVTIILDSKTK